MPASQTYPPPPPPPPWTAQNLHTLTLAPTIIFLEAYLASTYSTKHTHQGVLRACVLNTDTVQATRLGVSLRSLDWLGPRVCLGEAQAGRRFVGAGLVVAGRGVWVVWLGRARGGRVMGLWGSLARKGSKGLERGEWCWRGVVVVVARVDEGERKVDFSSPFVGVVMPRRALQLIDPINMRHKRTPRGPARSMGATDFYVNMEQTKKNVSFLSPTCVISQL